MKQSHDLLRCILFIILITGLLTGCSQFKCSYDQMDRSPFTGIPCDAPCWHGLMVGKSTESEVMAVMTTLPFLDQDTIVIHRIAFMSALDPTVNGPGAKIIASYVCPRKQCLTVSVVDDIVTGIEIVLNYEIHLKEAINYLGDPDFIRYQMLGAEVVTCEIQLIWKNRQLVLVSDAFHASELEKYCWFVRDTGKTVPSLVIAKVKYLTPGEIEILLSPSITLFKYSGTIPGE